MRCSSIVISRRVWISFLLGAASALGQAPIPDGALPLDWVCPMDPDVRSSKAGVCPRCGMKLSLHVPERLEFPLEMTHAPDAVKPGDSVDLTLRVLDPDTNRTATRFELVHEKLMHLFVVSENLQFFAHEHPQLQSDGTFHLTVHVPYGGMYRVLADYYPVGGVPQLAVDTFFAIGQSEGPHLTPAVAPAKAENLIAALHTDPEQPLAGLETKMFFTIHPADKLEPYLGAWGHMLAASEDLIDLIHLHPFLSDGRGGIQFNVIFPRSGLYRIWTQFQRNSVVNTVAFTLPVKEV